MSNEAKKMLMESCDFNAAILAAISRIDEVPASVTLIDTISDSDWTNEKVSEWHIEAGSDENGSSDELDDSDKEFVKVA